MRLTPALLCVCNIFETTATRKSEREEKAISNNEIGQDNLNPGRNEKVLSLRVECEREIISETLFRTFLR